MTLNLPQKAAVLLISGYQKTLSPDHGWLRAVAPTAGCRFHPSCSEYTKQAIVRHGFMAGCAKGAWRIVRCNPFTSGGYDPVN